MRSVSLGRVRAVAAATPSFDGRGRSRHWKA
jgi:hypothetical protein